MSALDKTILKLGEGSVVKLDSEEAIFKLDSFFAVVYVWTVS